MKKIIYATGNKAKLDSAKMFFSEIGIEVEGKKVKLPEIQADSIEEVAVHSSKAVFDVLKCAVLKNDTGLVIPSLNGFPSVYTKYAEQTIKEQGILKLLEDKLDRSAYYLEIYAYTNEEGKTFTFVSKTEGTISTFASGEYGWGFDRIFIPKGKEKSFSHFPDEERYKLWNNDGLKYLSKFLENN